MKKENLLMDALNSGIISLPDIESEYERMKRKECLAQHNYSIWEGARGFWYTYLPDETKKEKRRQISKKSKKELEDAIVEFYNKRKGDPTIKDVFENWQERRVQMGISQATISRERRAFRRHFASIEDVPIKSMTPMDFVEFIENEAYHKELPKKSLSQLKCLVRGILKRAKRLGYIQYAVDAALEAVEIPKGGYCKKRKREEDEVYTEEETAKIVTYLQCHLDCLNMGILLIFMTGLRVGELVALSHADFNWDCTFRVCKTETVYDGLDGNAVYEVKSFPKTEAGMRTVIIPRDCSWIEDAIRNTNVGSDYIFLSGQGQRATGNVIRRRLHNVCDLLEIPYKSPHKIRKTYATILLDNNVSNKVIISQMGHTDIACTEGYYHKDRLSKEQKLGILSSVKELSFTQPNTTRAAI